MPESGGKPPIDAAPENLISKSRDAIVIRGARQNNLKNLTLELPANELTVVTGVSGSGKSSLVFDTLYAEGQRRYVETFSPYARQFLDRMDKPQVDAIEGIPPAIAIDQTNPVRTSRSTVGTMTELNDHLKLLYARGAALLPGLRRARAARYAGDDRRRDDGARAAGAGDPRLIVTFPVTVPKNFSEKEVKGPARAARLHAHPRETRQDDRGRAGPLPRGQRGAGTRHRSTGSRAAGGPGTRERVRARRKCKHERGLALLIRFALPRLRHPLPGPDAEPLFRSIHRSARARPAAASAA